MSRYRNGQPVQGVAVPRSSINYPVYPYYPYYPVYPYYPYYGYGFGFGYGYGYGYGYPYYGYPWYGTSIGMYGGGGYGYDTGGGGGYENQYAYHETGSIRLRASPSNAKVYIDGALMGIVDDFDGLGHHLDLPVGQHQLELRADGYETFTTTIMVDAGKTLTERASLNKKK